MKIIWQCEICPFCRKVLDKHWPEVVKYGDIREMHGIERPDVIVGGFPCQPFSVAGKRKGKEDDRDLWPEMYRIIKELRPTWVLGENVANFVNMELDRTITDLENIGYACQAFVIPACAVEAPHERGRTFIVGYAERIGFGWESRRGTRQKLEDGHIQLEERVMADAESSMSSKPIDTWRRGPGPTNCGSDVAHSDCMRELQPGRSIEKFGEWSCDSSKGERRPAQSGLGGMPNGISSGLHGHRWPAGLGQSQYDWEPPRMAKGIKNRAARIKALGNAVSPQQIYPILEAIAEIEAN